MATDAFTSTPMAWTDWTGLKTNGQIHPTWVTTTAQGLPRSVKVCADHFPQGSQVRANIEESLTYLNAIPGVGIDLIVEEVPHEDDIRPDDEPIYDHAIHLDHLAGLEDAANATVFCANGWGSCTFGELARAGTILFNFADYFADPLDPSLDGEAPSVPVVLHELGHVLGFKHNDDRTHYLQLHSYSSGGGGAKEDTAVYTGYPSAMSLFQLRTFYSGGADISDLDIPEWHMHEVVINSAGHAEGFDDTSNDHVNPRKLYSLGGGNYKDCDAVGSSPTFLMQYSDLSRAAASQVVVRFDVERAAALGGGWYTVASRTHQSAQTAAVDYAQFDWSKTLEIPVAAVGTPAQLGYKMKVRASVNLGGASAERRPNNNQVVGEYNLYTSSACN